MIKAKTISGHHNTIYNMANNNRPSIPITRMFAAAYPITAALPPEKIPGLTPMIPAIFLSSGSATKN